MQFGVNVSPKKTSQYKRGKEKTQKQETALDLAIHSRKQLKLAIQRPFSQELRQFLEFQDLTFEDANFLDAIIETLRNASHVVSLLFKHNLIAHPPININIKKYINGKEPQSLKFCVTYPVPVRIEITLKATSLIFI